MLQLAPPAHQAHGQIPEPRTRVVHHPDERRRQQETDQGLVRRGELRDGPARHDEKSRRRSGAVLTPLWDGMPEEQRGAFLESEKGKCTTGEVGKPEDVAESYLYVMRDRNVSGSVIDTNGGSLLTSSS